MIGLDTNVFVRYITQDDPAQSERVNKQIEKWIREGKTLWISQIILCEVYWVLERCYKQKKEEIITVFTEMLNMEHIQIEQQEVFRLALNDYRIGSKAVFTDCLIGRQNVFQGCSRTYTFDKAAAKSLPLFFHAL